MLRLFNSEVPLDSITLDRGLGEEVRGEGVLFRHFLCNLRLMILSFWEDFPRDTKIAATYIPITMLNIKWRTMRILRVLECWPIVDDEGFTISMSVSPGERHLPPLPPTHGGGETGLL